MGCRKLQSLRPGSGGPRALGAVAHLFAESGNTNYVVQGHRDDVSVDIRSYGLCSWNSSGNVPVPSASIVLMDITKVREDKTRGRMYT